MTGHRVWRLRRLQQSMDAVLTDPGPDGVELRVVLNGSLIYSRRWPSPQAAIDDAEARRRDLEREGWMAHW